MNLKEEIKQVILILNEFGYANDAIDRGYYNAGEEIRRKAYEDLKDFFSKCSLEMLELGGSISKNNSLHGVGWSIELSKLESILKNLDLEN